MIKESIEIALDTLSHIGLCVSVGLVIGLLLINENFTLIADTLSVWAGYI